MPRYYRILDNQYLMFGVELGLVGLLAMLVFLVRRVLPALAARPPGLGAIVPPPRPGPLPRQSLASRQLVTFDAWGYPDGGGLTMLLVGLAGAAGALTTSRTRRAPTTRRAAGPPHGGVERRPNRERQGGGQVSEHVAVVVVTYNSADVLPGLVASLGPGLGDVDWQLVVADNASADDTVDVAPAARSGATVLAARPQPRVRRRHQRRRGGRAGRTRRCWCSTPTSASTRAACPTLLARAATHTGAGIVVPRLLDARAS